MKQYLVLITLVLLKSSTALASHQTQNTGGATLPSYESSAEMIIYILAPFIVFTLLLNELMQLYLGKQYKDSALKNAEDYLQYTLTASVFVVFLSLFTSVFHSLPELSNIAYGGLLVSLAVATALIKERNLVSDKLEEIK